MPEFKSRMDSYHWHTPLFGDIFNLDELAVHDESLIESNQARLAVALARMACAVQIEGARAMPSYTLYEASLEEELSDEALREIVYKIEAQEGWILAYSWQDTKRLHFFLRTANHQPLNLAHTLSRISFRKASHPSSFVVGVSLQQQVLVRDWDSIGHYFIVGDGGTKQSFVRSLVVTMLMSHTPSELRIGFIGTNPDDYRYLLDAPHALGKHGHNSPDAGLRLLRGMSKEVMRRRSIFERNAVHTLANCNRKLQENKEANLPRILLILDSLGQTEWVKHHAIWMPYLDEILSNGAELGIHVILTARGLHLAHPFDELSAKIPIQLITRSAATDRYFIEAVDPFHSSLVRFVDAFFVEDGQIIPVELASITVYDSKNIVTYWGKNAKERLHLNQLTGIQSPVSMKTILGRMAGVEDLPNPPVPEKPATMALVRAAEILAERNGSTHHRANSVYLAVAEVEEEKTTAQIWRDAKSQEAKAKYVDLQIDMDSMRRAQALATYLGWLGRGPLMDVLGLSLEEADVIIAILQARQILERTTSPTPHLHFRRRR